MREVGQQDVDVDTAMPRAVRTQTPLGLLELTLAPRAVSSASLVPGDCDVDESL